MKTNSTKKEISRASDKRRSKSEVENRPGAQAGATSRKPRSDLFSAPVGLPIVGVGASAGGLEAFTQLLQNLPTDTGMAFVLVQHLDPDHASALTQLLTRATPMPVREVTNNLRIEPNRVYVIPPNTKMGIAQRFLKLRPREVGGGPQRSVDFFFESLAQDQRERAIGVILSGTASDGTLGLEAIKAEGGITFAQDESAKYTSMPRSAVAAGCVDFVLSPEKIAKELARIARHPYLLAGAPEPPEDAGAAGGFKPRPQSGSRKHLRNEKDGFKKIVALLGNHCGVDFSLYKFGTIQRRINRRMVLSKLTTLEAYGRLLRGNAKELEALYSDVLIPVTGFFRNPEAFEVLKRAVFPRLIPERPDEPVRMWVSGCSTGQEAYSLAMVFAEYSDQLSRAPRLQIFATDLNTAVLDKARAGLYPKMVVQDAGVSPERLRRFFVAQDGGYRISKPVREAIVFSRQNLLSDPPFSRLDLVSCRNLLIYIEPSLQQKIVPTFHYALKPNGFLFLGASESVGSFKDIFEPVDKKHKIYFKKPGPTRALHLHFAPRPPEATKGSRGFQPPGAPEGLHGDLKALREADRVALARHAPPGVLVNAGLQVLQFRGDTSPYLKPPTGKASFDLLKMAREGLLLPLRAALNKARKEGKVVRTQNVPVHQNGQTRRTNIEVIRLKNLTEGCYLIFFEEAKEHGLPAALAPTIAKPEKIESPQARRRQGTPPEGRAGASKAERGHIAELDSELAETRDYLQSIQEQNEAANEELQASNEEVTSANEELQSLNEELETSKEELESANEELSTVNEEMTARNAELSHLNSDLVNFQSSACLAIVLLGRDLSVRRFTVQAEKHFNLLASDVGRSISKVRHNLKLPDLERFITEVIDTVHEQERDVKGEDGRWYSLRVRPYLSLDNKVDGAVLVLVDIDALKRTERTVVEAREHAEAVIRTVPEPLLVLNSDLRIHSANDAFSRTFNVSPAQMDGRLIFELDRGSWNIPRLRQLLEEILPRDGFFNDVEITHNFERLGRRTLLLNARQVNEPGGQPQLVVVGIRDITELLHLQAEMRRSELRYRRLFEAAKDGVLIIDPATQKILDANPFMTELLGYDRQEVVGKELFQIGLAKDEAAARAMFQELEKKGLILHDDLPLHTKAGKRCYVNMISHLYQESEERVVQCKIRDITQRKQAEEALRLAQAQLADRAGQLEQAVAERTAELSATNQQLQAFVHCIAHDLRAPLRSMQGFSKLLLEEVGEALSETSRDFADRISSAAQLMDAMLADLLAFSEISQQRIELSPVNLETVVQSVLSSVENEIQEKNARVEDSGEWPTVLAHEPTLGQVLFNLVSNALKFVKTGKAPLVRLRAEEGGTGFQPAGSHAVPDPSAGQQAGLPPRQEAQDVCPSGFVRVTVEDNGVGIALEHQEQIFRIFTRLHGGRHSGTGIGLAIVQQGVERMGGRVGVDSTPGQGSRFWFELRKA